MTNIKNLQNTIHGHSITAINALQIAKIRFKQELKNELPEHIRKMIERDLKRCEVITDQVLCFEVMDDFYRDITPGTFGE